MSQKPYVYARIKNYDPRSGQLTRRYTYQGKRFDCDVGWYRVGRAMGQELAEITHPASGVAVFDVCEADEAEALDKKDSKQPWANSVHRAEDAVPVKIGEFKRRSEIKATNAEKARQREVDSLTDWDDPSEEPVESKPKAPKEGKPKGRRSATK